MTESSRRRSLTEFAADVLAGRSKTTGDRLRLLESIDVIAGIDNPYGKAGAMAYANVLLDAGATLDDVATLTHLRYSAGQAGFAADDDAALLRLGVPIDRLFTLARRHDYAFDFAYLAYDPAIDAARVTELIDAGFRVDECLLAASSGLDLPEVQRLQAIASPDGTRSLATLKHLLVGVHLGAQPDDVTWLAERNVLPYEWGSQYRFSAVTDPMQRRLMLALTGRFDVPATDALDLAPLAAGSEDLAIVLLSDGQMTPEEAVRMAAIADRDQPAAPSAPAPRTVRVDAPVDPSLGRDRGPVER